MKRILSVFCMALMLLSMQAQKSVVVIGDIQGVKDSVTFAMGTTDGVGFSTTYSQDENNGLVKDGHFVLTYKCTNSEVRQFVLMTSSGIFVPYLHFQFWSNQGDTVYVKGSGNLPGGWRIESKAPEQQYLNAFQSACLKENIAYQQAAVKHEEYRQYRRNTEMSEQEWDRTKEELNRLAACRDSLKLILQKKTLEVMKTLPVNVVWMEQMISIIRTKAPLEEEIEEVYRMRADEINQVPDGKWVASLFKPRSKAEIGKLYIDGDLYDLTGKQYRLEDFRGKYVLLDFWSVYCGPCVGAFPEMKKIFEKYSDRLVIIGLNLDKEGAWRSSDYNKQIVWYNLSDKSGNSGLAVNYEVNLIPVYLLVSPEGVYLHRWEGDSTIFEEGVLAKYLK